MILVGEMRDLETIETAITAAETGHVVFGTLHTTGAQGTINRIIDVFPTTQQEQIRTQLSVAIIGVLSQTLIPKIGGGRVAAYEMLVITPAVANLIRENKTFRITSAIQTGHKQGMQLLDDHMFKLWKDGLVEKRDILLKAHSVDELQNKIARAERGMFEDEEEATRAGRGAGFLSVTMAIRRIGQILVDLGFLDEDQLETLLDEQQQRPGEMLGQIAISLNMVNDEQLAQALGEQMGMQVVK